MINNEVAAVESILTELKEPDTLKLSASKVLKKSTGCTWFGNLSCTTQRNANNSFNIGQIKDQDLLVADCVEKNKETCNQDETLQPGSITLIESEPEESPPTMPENYRSTNTSGSQSDMAVESIEAASVVPTNSNEVFTDIAETDVKYIENGYYERYKIQHKADKYDLKLADYDSSSSSDYQCSDTCSSEDE